MCRRLQCCLHKISWYHQKEGVSGAQSDFTSGFSQAYIFHSFGITIGTELRQLEMCTFNDFGEFAFEDY